MAAHKPGILVPIDFSPHSLAAIKAAFVLAHKLNAQVTLLHVYNDDYQQAFFTGGDELSVGNDINAFVVEGQEIRGQADSMLVGLTDKIRHNVADGKLPPVSFITHTCDGIPEDAIMSYAKENPPLLIVMGSRGAHDKARQLIGSVTAEIIDNTKYPVLAIPYDRFKPHFYIPSHIAIITPNQDGIVRSLSYVEELMPNAPVEITIIKLVSDSRELMASNSNLTYSLTPAESSKKYTFTNMTLRTLLNSFDRSQKSEKYDFLVIPSLRKNILERLFNPGPAHRLLLSVDLPILVIPLEKK